VHVKEFVVSFPGSIDNEYVDSSRMALSFVTVFSLMSNERESNGFVTLRMSNLIDFGWNKLVTKDGTVIVVPDFTIALVPNTPKVKVTVDGT
jgi:hypothetical protein